MEDNIEETGSNHSIGTFREHNATLMTSFWLGDGLVSANVARALFAKSTRKEGIANW